MSHRRRLLWLLPLLLVVAAAGYTVWLAEQVQGRLTAAEESATRLQQSIDHQDPAARDRAVTALRENAAAAAERTDGAWWGALTHLPVVGDDATGVRAISRSLDTISRSGVRPLSDSMDRLDRVAAGGHVRVDVVRSLHGPVTEAHRAFASADADLAGLDSSGYAGALKSRFVKYAALVHDTAGALSSAETATKVLPDMIGADGPRNYLLVFQNNAEIRATGGMPGSWALVHADAGRLSITRQGTAGDFPEQAAPVLPLTKSEIALHQAKLGTFYQDAGFTPDFPRTAELWTAHWAKRFPDTPLDGVVSLDPVAMSYLLEATGPVKVGDTTVTGANAVEELLNKPYVELDPAAQDALFAQAARGVFEATTGDLKSPLTFVRGMERAAREGRLLIAPADPTIRKALGGTRVEGALATDDGTVPHVDIGLNDGTGSKMSYYLRYWADVEPMSCRDGVQTMSGSLTLSQNIAPDVAAKLPPSVTGGGNYGVRAGQQVVAVLFYGPYGGNIDRLSIDGKRLDDIIHVVDYRGRPATEAFAQLSSRKDVVFNWTMTTGPDQTGAVHLGMTPSIVPGNNDATFKSAC